MYKRIISEATPIKTLGIKDMDNLPHGLLIEYHSLEDDLKKHDALGEEIYLLNGKFLRVQLSIVLKKVREEDRVWNRPLSKGGGEVKWHASVYEGDKIENIHIYELSEQKISELTRYNAPLRKAVLNALEANT